MLYLEYDVREQARPQTVFVFLSAAAETEARPGGSSCQGFRQLAYGVAPSCNLLTYLEAQQGGVDWGLALDSVPRKGI